MVFENVEMYKILRILLGFCKYIVFIVLKVYSLIIVRNVYKIIYKYLRFLSFYCFVLL